MKLPDSITEIFKNYGLDNWNSWQFSDFSYYFPIFHIQLRGCKFTLDKFLIFESGKNKETKIKNHCFHLGFLFDGNISIENFVINDKHKDWLLINKLYEYFHAKYLIYNNEFVIINQEIIFLDGERKEINEIVL
jgi:hypothetical protein